MALDYMLNIEKSLISPELAIKLKPYLLDVDFSFFYFENMHTINGEKEIEYNVFLSKDLPENWKINKYIIPAFTGSELGIILGLYANDCLTVEKGFTIVGGNEIYKKEADCRGNYVLKLFKENEKS
jgi:hypothetical protein